MYTQDPWKEIEAMERQMERMMAAFMQGGRCPSCDGENACGHEKIINELPPYDICTGDSAVHVLVEVQGKTANDIEVIADREMLTIATSPPRGESTDGEGMQVTLPVPIIPGTVQWDVVHGVLEITAARDLSTAVRED
jgi:HSP20 family molecular chaperone IbpA